MNTTSSSHSAGAPSFLAKAASVARNLIPTRAVTAVRDVAEILHLAQECRHSAPSLSQELRAIACRN